MPVLDGYGATRAIRKLPSPTCDVPIIALTANAMAEDHALCFEAGMGGVVTKPISKNDLLTSLINVMEDSGGAERVTQGSRRMNRGRMPILA